MDADDDKESSYESVTSPPQEYFPIATQVKCPQVLACFKADVPPLYSGNEKDKFYTRNVVKRSKISQIKNLTNRPKRSVPPNALNTWRDLTPDVKLPDIRNRTLGTIYYTRGKLGEKLHRTKPEFDLSDPVNTRKVVGIEKYSALHDPNCKSYFNRPSVVRHLRKQKLINERKEVLCDVHEFNKYRSYLGELFNDQVKRRIDDNNAMEDMERGLIKSLCAKQVRKERDMHKDYQLKHLEMNLAYEEARRRRFRGKINVWKRRLQQIDSYRSQVKLAHTGMYTMKHWNAFLTRQKAANAEERRKSHTLIRIAYAETKNDYVTKYDKFVRLALFERYKADQAAVMIARDDQIDDMEQLVDETLKKARASWLKKYDAYIEHCRENPLSHYQYQLKAAERKKYLMQKYFYMWIEYVITQRETRPNEAHQSVFQVDRKLKPFVDNLRTFSASDFEIDDTVCGAGDFECKAKKMKKTAKLLNLARSFPSNSKNAGSKMNQAKGQTSTLAFGDSSRELNSISSEERRKKKKKKLKKKQMEEEDGNEADVEEPDDFIDKMVTRFKLGQDQLKKRLEKIPPSHMPTLGTRDYVPKQFFKGAYENRFDDTQEEQKETITFLREVNNFATTEAKEHSRKAMKL